jgi:hypothetical protein
MAGRGDRCIMLKGQYFRTNPPLPDAQSSHGFWPMSAVHQNGRRSIQARLIKCERKRQGDDPTHTFSMQGLQFRAVYRDASTLNIADTSHSSKQRQQTDSEQSARLIRRDDKASQDAFVDASGFVSGRCRKPRRRTLCRRHEV